MNNVRSLFAFGSVTTDGFKPNSDIDLVVDIDDNDPISYSDKYFSKALWEISLLRLWPALGGVRKYYLNDPAFRSFFFGFYPQDTDYYLENYVFLQLKRQGFKISVGVMNGNEIDFVAHKAEKTVYYQVAYLLSEPATFEREFGNLVAIKDNYEKAVISLDEMDFSDYRGVKHIRPWELEG